MGKRCPWIHGHGKKVDHHHEISQGRLSELQIQSLREKSGYTPGGMTNLTATPGMLPGSFTMEIDWHEDDPGCACCCGEYRQFVRGFVKINGIKQTKKLFNG